MNSYSHRTKTFRRRPLAAGWVQSDGAAIASHAADMESGWSALLHSSDVDGSGGETPTSIFNQDESYPPASFAAETMFDTDHFGDFDRTTA